ncbi:hypothetical protein DUNSADRAFT_5501 [Dunaliella salina]|uniref:Secreted protein n=1 Tax=Dunaliella salina TaxID=3046 RepID=A0ABQ7H7A9_DUNSA|nr:hypothetical protein DUNSADRAFT_5501 [Dunaliella salina]KAF5842733.1 hypothetical protein DUNSADRAFT_5501 [Dunaliella salina]KAF5842734.1 hypothetical protein DUNSADRAFT_5501 [Dunaliella salina]|eukprot:KAF5842732.1 hypothetical protein DUNSADRAFT_5501 [Dunaliella salina]
MTSRSQLLVILCGCVTTSTETSKETSKQCTVPLTKPEGSTRCQRSELCNLPCVVLAPFPFNPTSNWRHPWLKKLLPCNQKMQALFI